MDPVGHHHGVCGLPDRDALLASGGIRRHLRRSGSPRAGVVDAARQCDPRRAGGMGWLGAGVAADRRDSRDVVGLEHAGGRGARLRPHAGRAAGSDGSRPGRPGARTAVARDRNARARVRPQLDPLRPARGRDRSGPAGTGDRPRAGGARGHRTGGAEPAARPDRGAPRRRGGRCTRDRPAPRTSGAARGGRLPRRARGSHRGRPQLGSSWRCDVHRRRGEPAAARLHRHRCDGQRQRALRDVASRYRHDHGPRLVVGGDRWLVEPRERCGRGFVRDHHPPVRRPGGSGRDQRAGLPSIRQGPPPRDGAPRRAPRPSVPSTSRGCCPSVAWGRCSPSSPASWARSPP